jgi:hypothetical protein
MYGEQEHPHAACRERIAELEAELAKARERNEILAQNLEIAQRMAGTYELSEGEQVSGYELPTCEKCGGEYTLRDGQEPTPCCDECAHAEVDRLEAELSAARALLEKATEFHLSVGGRWIKPWGEKRWLAYDYDGYGEYFDTAAEAVAAAEEARGE